MSNGNPLGLSRHTAGRIMVLIAYVGVASAVIGAVVGWRFLGELSEANKQGLELAEESLTAADASLTVADNVISAVDDTLAAVSATVRTVAGSIEATASVAESTALLAAQLPDTIDRIDNGLESIEGITATIDRTLGQLSSIPFGPDYDPDVTLSEAISDLRADISPLGDTLRTISDDLTNFAGGSGDLEADLDDVAVGVDSVQTALAGSSAVIEQARQSTADALALSQSTLNDVGTQLALTRLLLVIVAVAIAIGQIVPYWVGRELLAHPAAGPPTNAVGSAS